jgi:hypothetical protein
MTAHQAGVAVFICSSDNRRDVLDHVLPSVAKFWPDCPYPIYVGLNSMNRPLAIGTPLLAPASEWHREFSSQLEHIPEERLIVLLDDYLLGMPVDQTRLSRLVEQAFAASIDYLRLVPLGRSLAARISGWHAPEVSPGIERIRHDRPFYSGLQIAIWSKSHLQSMLQRPMTVWEFEHLCTPNSVHCAVKSHPPILYRHLVEQGRWLPHARMLLRRAGLHSELGSRPVWSDSRYAKLILDRVQWTLWGYATS